MQKRTRTTGEDTIANARIRDGIPRPLEAVAALVGLLVAAPILALAAMAIAVSSSGPVFFRQQRVGRRGRNFTLLKFRTMRPVDTGPLVTARGDDRVTRVGKLLRKTKLDELPELWNIFKGEMSLVGPRPEVPRYVNLDNPRWRLVLEARPGLTDPMTLRLRNEEELLAEVEGDREEFYLERLQPFKVEGYLEYLLRRNCWSDIGVLWSTVVVIVLPHRALLPTVQEIGGMQQRSN